MHNYAQLNFAKPRLTPQYRRKSIKIPFCGHGSECEYGDHEAEPVEVEEDIACPRVQLP